MGIVKSSWIISHVEIQWTLKEHCRDGRRFGKYIEKKNYLFLSIHYCFSYKFITLRILTFKLQCIKAHSHHFFNDLTPYIYFWKLCHSMEYSSIHWGVILLLLKIYLIKFVIFFIYLFDINMKGYFPGR